MVVLNRYFSTTTKRTADDVSLKLLQKIILIKCKKKICSINKLCMYINQMCENKNVK